MYDVQVVGVVPARCGMEDENKVDWACSPRRKRRVIGTQRDLVTFPFNAGLLHNMHTKYIRPTVI